MKKFLLLALVGFGFLNFGVATRAQAELYHLGKYKVGVTKPSNWTPVFGLYGTPISYLSDVNQTGLRTTIGIYDAEIDGQTFDYAELRKDVGDYYQGRKKWLALSQNSHFEKELPFEPFKNKSGTEGYRIGFAYELNGHEFQEYSYYLVCSDHMFHVKAIIPNGSVSNGTEVTQMIQGFQCAKDSKSAQKFSAISKETVQMLKKDPGKRSQMVDALREFLIDAENNAEDHSPPKKGSTSFNQKIKTLIDGLLVWGNTANAAGNANCFFAGWPSHFNANHTCDFPDDIANSNQTQGCGDGQMACNPNLFGNNVCVNVSDSAVKAHATVYCDAEYKKDLDKHKAEITANLAQHPEVIDATLNTVNSVCGNKAYVNAKNLGLCSTLSDRLSDLGKTVDPVKKAIANAKAPANYQSIRDQTDSDISAFEQICLVNGQPNFNSEHPTQNVQTSSGEKPVNCVELAKTIKKNVDELEKIDPNYTADPNSCAPTGPLANLNDLQNAEPACSETQKAKNRSTCLSDVGCMIAATVSGPVLGPIFQMIHSNNPSAEVPNGPKKCDLNNDSCLTNLITGAVESLWSTIKGFGQIAEWAKDKVVAGVKGTASFVANTTKKTLNFFGATYDIENQSANKGQGAAQMSPSKLSQFMHHPVDFMSDLLKGMLAGINNWMKTDVYCQKWDGVPHFSNCSKPLDSFDCLDCKTSMNGACTVGGYVVAEFIPAFLTGGIAGIAEGAETAGMMAKFLTKAEESGKLAKQTIELAKEFPAFASRTADVVKDTRIVKTAAKAVEFTGEVVKGSYAKVGKMMSEFLVDHPGLDIVADKVSAVSMKIGQKGKSFSEWYAGLQENAYQAGYRTAQGAKSGAGVLSDSVSALGQTVKWKDAQITNTFRPEFESGEFTNAGKNITFTQKGVDGTAQGTVIGKGLDGKSVIVADSKGDVVVLRGNDLQSVKVNPAAPHTDPQATNFALGSNDGKLSGKGVVTQFRNAPAVSFMTGNVEHDGQLAGLAADGKNFLVRGTDNQFYVVSKDAIDTKSTSAQKVIAKIEKEQAAKKETDATTAVTTTTNTSTKSVKMPANRVSFPNSVTDTFPAEFQARTYSAEGQNITFQLRGVDGTSHGTVVATGLDGKSVFVADSKGNVVRVAGKDLQTVKVDAAATQKLTADASGALGTYDGNLNGKGSIGQFRGAPNVSFKVGDVEHEGQLVGLAADGKNFVVRGNDNKFYSLDKGAIESNKAQKVMTKIEDEQVLHAKATQSAEDATKFQEDLAARKKAADAKKVADAAAEAAKKAALKQSSDDAARLAKISKPQMQWKEASLTNTFRTEFDANQFSKTSVTFTQNGVKQEGTFLGKGIDGKSAYVLDSEGKPVFLTEKDLQTVAPNVNARVTKVTTKPGNTVGVYDGKVRGQGVIFSNPVDFTIKGVEHEGQLAGFTADGKNFLARGNDNQLFVISKDQITSPSAQKIADQYEKDQALRAETSPPAARVPASGTNSNFRNKKPSVRTPNQTNDSSDPNTKNAAPVAQ